MTDVATIPIIVRLAPEIHLKSPSTRRHFTRVLRRNLKRALIGIPHDLRTHQGRLVLYTPEPEAAQSVIRKTFGISTFSPVDVVLHEVSVDRLCEVVADRFTETVRGRRYAVRCKRHGRKNISASDVERRVGAVLDGPGRVDLDHPEVVVRIDLDRDQAWIYSKREPGGGGLPLGVQGRAMVLISGGFDSAVAAWYIMRRGTAVDFVFCNLGGAVHEEMVLAVCRRLVSAWGAGIRPRMFSVDFSGVVEDLRAQIPGDAWQIVLKRLMYRAALPIAHERGAEALVTGEALSQVSSQTLSNLQTIDAVADLPVLRPLIGFDKTEIMNRARAIGTFELCEKVPEFCAIANERPMVTSKRAHIEGMERALSDDCLKRAVSEARVHDLGAPERPEQDRTSPLLVDRIPEATEVIDCQPPEFYRDWHVPGAVNHPADEFATSFVHLPRDRSYVLYCFRGTQSAILAERMRAAGYDARAFAGDVARLRRLWGQQPVTEADA
ncbi:MULTISPECIES: tRNA uracil 4-sulfurtransferase ThiI [unclassified Thioalkalivibrio]|uniref:tRNA uracil 4-sulfurtransferase ThiI n=1 Tax=unclassified Thioalkalivibrio TaxID=2621013 RepID=UPI0003720A88|nr:MULTISPECIES: tRNA uracil 4-sulfurtransferase ThiI [unclassified Thioalkalivibrio]